MHPHAMAPFDRSHTSSYSSSIVTMALEHLIDRAIFRLRIIKSYRNLDFKVTPLSDAKYLGNGMIHILTHPTQGCQLE